MKTQTKTFTEVDRELDITCRKIEIEEAATSQGIPANTFSKALIQLLRDSKSELASQYLFAALELSTTDKTFEKSDLEEMIENLNNLRSE